MRPPDRGVAILFTPAIRFIAIQMKGGLNENAAVGCAHVVKIIPIGGGDRLGSHFARLGVKDI